MTEQPPPPDRPSTAPQPRTSFAEADTREDTRTLFERLGGREGIARVVDSFYDAVEADPDLREMFPPDSTSGREKQRLFLEQFLGGEPLYSAQWGHPRLRRRHFPFVIDQRQAGRWLRHMGAALLDSGAAREDVTLIMEQFGPLAKHMVNAGDDVPREPLSETRLA